MRRKQVKVACIICNTEFKIDKLCSIVNEPWCESCIDIENKRSIKEDSIGSFQYFRPPKYAISKIDWKKFGY